MNCVACSCRRGVTLTHKPGVYEMSMPDDDQHMLRLQRVRSTDVGQLVVTASNQFGSDLCMLQLAMAGELLVLAASARCKC